MATKKEQSIEIIQVTKGRIECCVLGLTPLILNRMSQKAKHTLLFPGGRKTAAEKKSQPKHDPIAEFRESAYKDPSEDAPTLLMIQASAFKGAMKTAALDLPGASKSMIGRLTFVEGDYVHIYGIPKLFMAITRSADMKRTPDVRTRAIVPEWAARVTVSYTMPLLRETAVINLLAAAGITAGVGDWRPEKGAGNYGQFMLVPEGDERFQRLMQQGREAQKAALEAPEPYDAETADLLRWFDAEAARRGFKVVA